MWGICEPSRAPLAKRSRKASRPGAEPRARSAQAGGRGGPKQGISAVEMGARQREISVSEFFTKNRHLLGFDNPRKALLTCVKEAVDNALDACEEGRDSPGHRRQGGGGRQRRPAAPGEPGEPLPHHRHRQRPGHRPAADPADLRQAPVRLEVPSAAHEPRPAGHRHLGRRHVRSAHDRQAGPDHLAHRARGRPRTSSRSRSIPRRTSRRFSRRSRSTGSRRAAPRSPWKSRAATRKAAPRSTSTSSRRSSRTRTSS